MFPNAGIDDIRKTFASQGYVKIEGLIDDALRCLLYDHVQRIAPMASPSKMQGQPGSVEMGGDHLMEFVLNSVQPRVEDLSGLKLYPTYSFFRIYRRGNTLQRHIDRPSCEVSISLNLGPALETPWPLWIKGPLGASAVAMNPGEAVLYRGTECEHWREPLEADQLTQLFLHYVDQHGRNSEWKFDKRPSTGT